jgi:hypothetical protein
LTSPRSLHDSSSSGRRQPTIGLPLSINSLHADCRTERFFLECGHVGQLYGGTKIRLSSQAAPRHRPMRGASGTLVATRANSGLKVSVSKRILHLTPQCRATSSVWRWTMPRNCSDDNPSRCRIGLRSLPKPASPGQLRSNGPTMAPAADSGRSMARLPSCQSKPTVS